MRAFFPLLLVSVAAGCADQPSGNVSYGSTTPRYERPQPDRNLLTDTETPVRIGELGPSFAACNAQGEVRERAAEGAIPVLAAPFESARQVGQLPAGTSFFICSRSHDQRWLGVVYDAGGQANRNCGVAVPVSGRRDYEGPCDSGWVASAQVRLVSGVRSPSAEPSQNAAELK
jgi:hypothetical protein